MVSNFKGISSMDREERLSRYKNDANDEAVIEQFNGALAGLEKQLEVSTQGIPGSSILITGAPRSGTTFLYQLMASSLPFAYVSNLMARFYAAPLTGAWLQSRLIHSEITELGSFKSTHGVTARIYEPHEFGYFWGRHFPFADDNHQDVNKAVLRERIQDLEKTLQSVAGIFQKPVVYKCMISPFVLDEILANTSVFVVHLVRDQSEVTRSILDVRNERLGSIEKWWSIRPAGWKDAMKKSPQEQVDWQYQQVVGAIKKGCALFPEKCIEVQYADLIKSPKSLLARIAEQYQSFADGVM